MTASDQARPRGQFHLATLLLGMFVLAWAVGFAVEQYAFSQRRSRGAQARLDARARVERLLEKKLPGNYRVFPGALRIGGPQADGKLLAALQTDLEIIKCSSLQLHGTAIVDEDLRHLPPDMRRLILLTPHPDITPAGLAELQQYHPRCQVLRSRQPSTESPEPSLADSK